MIPYLFTALPAPPPLWVAVVALTCLAVLSGVAACFGWLRRDDAPPPCRPPGRLWRWAFQDGPVPPVPTHSDADAAREWYRVIA